MSADTPTFLNRHNELERLASLLRQGKSVLVHGPAGTGKTSLLGALRRQPSAPSLLLGPANLDPAPWMRQVLLTLVCERGLASLCRRLELEAPVGEREARAALARKSGGAARALLFEAFSDAGVAVALDPLGFVSRPLYELLRELGRKTGTPFVFTARSAHMEDIGYVSKFALPQEQRLALGGLPAAEAAHLFESAVAGWPRRPANFEEFRRHVLDYADGNPGTILGLARLARENAYWAGDRLKLHLLTVDFNLQGHAAVP